MDLFSLLKRDHDELSNLMQRLIAMPDPQHESVRDLQEALADLLVNHSKMEELYLYSRMQNVAAARELIGHSYKEHQEAANTLQQLQGRQMESEQWVQICKTLMKEVTDHAQKEEQQLFPLIRQELPSAEIDGIYQQMMDYREHHLIITQDVSA